MNESVPELGLVVDLMIVLLVVVVVVEVEVEVGEEVVVGLLLLVGQWCLR
jgi:hypothetical protein